jgi:hypothetical protein
VSVVYCGSSEGDTSRYSKLRCTSTPEIFCPATRRRAACDGKKGGGGAWLGVTRERWELGSLLLPIWRPLLLHCGGYPR